MINGLSLFSGIGGIDVALSEYVRPVAYCEIDPYCQGVLLSRMAGGFLSSAPIWPDIRTLNTRGGNRLCSGYIDIIYGGFPCQGISVAGIGKGLADERSGLFYEIVRLCREIRPQFIFLENVPAITSRGGREVVGEITALGYDCRWCVISAASVGALHRRERWFLLANAKSKGFEGQREIPVRNEATQPEPSSSSDKVGICDPNSQPSQQTDREAMPVGNERDARRNNGAKCGPFESVQHWQEIVSEMGKCSDGISNHVDRLRSLGNAVVSVQVKEAFEILIGIK